MNSYRPVMTDIVIISEIQQILF